VKAREQAEGLWRPFGVCDVRERVRLEVINLIERNLSEEFERRINAVSARVTMKGSLGKWNGRGPAVG